MQKATFPVPQYHYFSVPHAGTLGFAQILSQISAFVCCNLYKVAFAKVPPPQPTDLPVKEVFENGGEKRGKAEKSWI